MKHLALLMLLAAPVPAQPVRIGVFDSRAVALAYGRSEAFLQSVKAMRAELDKAKAAGDQKRIAELEKEGPWIQVRMHQQVFSTATVSGILAQVKDRLPEVASQAGVAVIVSKWEVQFASPSVETVDVTPQLVSLFHPNAQALKFIGQMKDQPPVPFEKLPLDPNR
jgi:hypothetical protein